MARVYKVREVGWANWAYTAQLRSRCSASWSYRCCALISALCASCVSEERKCMRDLRPSFGQSVHGPLICCVPIGATCLSYSDRGAFLISIFCFCFLYHSNFSNYKNRFTMPMYEEVESLWYR